MTKYSYMTLISIASIVLILNPQPDHAENKEGIKKTIVAGNMNRTYMEYLPPGMTADEPVPLVIVLHGANGSGQVMNLCSGFNRLADKNKFIVLYPDAYGPMWNDGRVDMDSISFKAGVDDVQFILHLVDTMISEKMADPKRVYVAGFSNGGMMALRISIVASERIAAAASVSGLLPKHLALFRPGKPVPLMMIHGTDDRVVPWTGGALTRKKMKHGEVLSVLDTALYWARNNGCSSQVSVRILPDRDTLDGTVGFMVRYGCPGPEREVLLVTIQGGGHTWPGAAVSLPELNPGKTSHDLDASQFIWDFFSRHTRP